MNSQTLFVLKAVSKTAALVLLTGLIGCNSAPPPVAEAVQVGGVVLKSDGTKVGDVAISFEPLESGYAKKAEVNAKGEFSCSLTPGKYAYYFLPKAGAKGTPATVAGLTEPKMDRTVQVLEGKPLEIKIP